MLAGLERAEEGGASLPRLFAEAQAAYHSPLLQDGTPDQDPAYNVGGLEACVL